MMEQVAQHVCDHNTALIAITIIMGASLAALILGIAFSPRIKG
jgi:hypothetical protein